MLDFDWSILDQSLPLLQQGIVVTLKITITAVILGMVLGTLLHSPGDGFVVVLSYCTAIYKQIF